MLGRLWKGGSVAILLPAWIGIGVGRLPAQGADLPPPHASRPPVITESPPDSIRRDVAMLRATSLIDYLRHADTTALGLEFQDIRWGPLDQVSQQNPNCQDINLGLARLRSLLGTTPGHGLPIFLGASTVVASADKTTVTGFVTVVTGRSSSVTGKVELALDSKTARWSTIDGIVSVLCASTATSP